MAAAGFNNVPECPTPVKLAVKGSLPHWLSGTLWRTGPGTYSIPCKKGKPFEVSHWFDGLAQHHRFAITPGATENDQPMITYNSRNAAKADYEYIERNGSWDTVTFGQDQCKTLFRRFFSAFQPAFNSENVSVTVTPDFPGLPKRHGREPSNLVAKTDANTLALINPETLEVEKLSTYATALPELTGPLAAAHSCRADGYLYNYNLAFGAAPTYRVFAIHEESGKGTLLATIKDAPGAYLHSLALTERFVILSIWQADYTMKGISILVNQNLASSFKDWDAKRETIFYIIDRHAKNGKGVRARVTTPVPFFCFHHINAYEDGDSIVLDLAGYDSTAIISGFRINNLRSVEATRALEPPALHRYRLPTAKPRGVAELVYKLPRSIELPVVNPAHYHKRYRYAYGIHTTELASKAGIFVDAIAKVDVDAQTTVVWSGRATEVPGEPIFVPTPGARAEDEDDGVLLTVVFDIARGLSALVVIDAKTMTELGRAELEQVVPYGFHGAWRSHSQAML